LKKVKTEKSNLDGNWEEGDTKTLIEEDKNKEGKTVSVNRAEMWWAKEGGHWSTSKERS